MVVQGIGKIPATRTIVGITAAMEGKIHAHYNHNDSCRLSRWTARESFQYMYARPWHKVSDFHLDLVCRGGYSSLSSLFNPENNKSKVALEYCHGDEESNLVDVPSEKRKGRLERITFKIVLSYHGSSFDGWQKQPGLNTVQGLVEKSLGIFVDERKVQQLKERSLPVEGCVVVTGRTDKGVTALQQVCSFYTWRKDVKSSDLKDAINAAAPGKLRVLFISEVSRVFHPNFSAKWRRYFYIFPLADSLQIQVNANPMDNSSSKNEDDGLLQQQAEHIEDRDGSTFNKGDNCIDNVDMRMKPSSFSVDKVNQLLCQLEGRSLSYRTFARDTKTSRSSGPPTECFMFHARAAEAKLPCIDKDSTEEIKVMCVELVANRFLRKMVRVLVATAIREAAAGADADALLNLMNATCRRATAPPAPPDGLCLVDVGYGDFNCQNSLIL
ncbi:uncharacterized protein LOC110103858 [Dendrobium catenatum]|uniref:tRNA pseudouridine synthase n=1 Tax=Dendrobium catenatum TaxID=906689 RepID=A0A2I0VIA4_9ASPA|nr:uncharacterized protein LOC110103858 [Dendrobium catenatum]XP_020688380.1 uncharacterized protein LOC110103858 [Dendrobium catenatum]XP_020688381.1 uncharacterized protein LOC110103858 [Dendrobium catenatum]PKU63114.1 tRNA pseudouridine38-40 synthase [Dendrobium catenatum]